jgi:hypothetical protein
LLTVAEICALLPTIREEGAAWLMVTEMSGVRESGLAALVEHPAIPKTAAKATTPSRKARRQGREKICSFIPR